MKIPLARGVTADSDLKEIVRIWRDEAPCREQCFDFLAACQAQWLHFHVRHETSFPGISSAAHPLVATLVFGLYEMVRCLPVPGAWRFDPFDAVSLAGWLVQRMCNARAVMLHSGEQEMKRRKYQGRLNCHPGQPISIQGM